MTRVSHSIFWGEDYCGVNPYKAVPSELLRLIVIPFCKSAVQWREVMNQIASSNFNPKEISADNSPYVADLGIKLDGLKNILDRIDRNLSISDEIRKSIWVSSKGTVASGTPPRSASKP